MSKEKPPAQPAALRLANMGRGLRRRAREFTRAEKGHHAGHTSYTEAYVEACESELERAALKYASALAACNGGILPAVD